MDADPRPRVLRPIEKSLFPQADFFQKESRSPRVGVALSGGGIRSATLSLGIFQGLAKLGLLRHIDYLSTVSGGGYFGGFFGHLVQRAEDVAGKDRLERLRRQRGDDRMALVEELLTDLDSEPLKHLRENGRYLSPNGAGDLLLGAAVALRNWVSVLWVVSVFALSLLSLAALVRLGLEEILVLAGRIQLPIPWPAPVPWPVPWLSPWWIGAAAALVFLAVPPGWAYWMVPDRRDWHPWQSLFFRWLAVAVGIGAGVWAFLAPGVSLTVRWLLIGLGVVALLTLGCYWAAPRTKKLGEPRSVMRSWLSRAVARALIVVAVLAGLALVDSIARWIVVQGHGTLGGAVYALAVGAAAFMRRNVASLVDRLGANKRPPLPVNLLVYAAAGTLIVATLSAIGTIPYFVTLGGNGAPPVYFPAAPTGGVASLAWLFGASAVLAWVIGRLWPFVNRSSLHAVYEARLRRAYLGASNKDRVGEGENRPPLTEPLPTDGLPLAEYDPARFGGPVHLINVTVNETVMGRSQVEQHDRKGMGMAVGPVGVSVARTHHAVWSDGPGSDDRDRGGEADPAPTEAGAEERSRRGSPSPSVDRFRVFARNATPEDLDVGQWIAISGAAFSTGLGSRTNLGLSLLAGLFNIRLGYWWRSGIAPRWRTGATRRTRAKRAVGVVRSWFPVQSSLMDEWLARFPGVAREDWYLSDGGHFENLAGYELIRRRLPFIVMCDNEGDPDYRFSGLANLVRKARLDFDAHVRFLDDAALKKVLPDQGDLRKWIRPLSALRRGKRAVEPVDDPVTKQSRLDVQSDRGELSLARAALARIEYADGERGWLLYLKPTLLGDEPADVAQYHAEHPDFPHESTVDQFFDEAQWESYRRLGEHMASRLFGMPAAGPTAGVPSPWSPWAAMTGGSG